MRTISAVLIVKDEEAYLRECLASLRGVVDEVVVADTGSADRTVEIAREFTEQVFHHVWADDFGAARNFALGHASGDYALSIDADERVVNMEEAGGLLRAFMAGQGAEVVGTVEIVNVTGVGAAAREVVDHTERFFCRERFEFRGAIHEQVTPLSGCKRSARTGVRLRHWGYAQAPDAPDHKAYRNIQILEGEIRAHPDDEYYRYQLGKAYFTLERYAEAIGAFEQALGAVRFRGGEAPVGRLGAVAGEVLADVVVSLAYAYVNVGRVAAAEQFLSAQAALGHAGTRRADFHHVRGYVYLMLGDLAKSRAAYRESMQCGAALEDVRGTGTFSSAYHLGLLSEAAGDLSEAAGYYVLSLRLKPDYAVTLSRCIDLITERRMALPREVWEVCDQHAFVRLYLERIGKWLGQGDRRSVALLAEASGALSVELSDRCRALLEAHVDRPGEAPGCEEAGKS